MDLPDSVAEIIKTEIKKLSLSPTLSPETGIIRNYLDWLFQRSLEGTN